MKQRNHTFDFLCALCILRMVTLHVFQSCGFSQESWWKEVMAWSFYFICFFFFKAGYFNRSVGGPTWAYVKDRTKRLFIPYVCCGLIGLALFWGFRFALEGVYSVNPVKFLWAHTWLVSDFYGNVPVWFLFSFYITYIFIHFMEKVRHLHWIVLAFPFIGYWLFYSGNPLWLNLNNIFIGTFFFYLGQVWHNISTRLNRTPMVFVSLTLIAVFVVCNILWHGTYSLHSNYFEGNPWGAMINSAIVVCGLSGLLIALRMPRIPLLNFIGEHSMVYFVLHFPIIFFYKHIGLCFHHSMRGHIDDAILALLLIFVTCTWLVPYFERIPWLSGRWKKA